MEPFRASAYTDSLAKRAKQSRAYTSHQLTGLEIADILNDRRHKALYMKLAKQYGPDRVLQLAKSVAERKDIRKPGAYFMRLLKELPHVKRK